MTKTYDFETALSELESVTGQMDGEVKLEVALDLYERGIQLSRACEDFLRGAAQRIEILRIRQDGTIETEPFASQDSQNEKNAAEIETETTQVSVRLQKKAGKRSSETSQLNFELANQP